MLRYPWADARAALLDLAADQPDLEAVQVTYVNPETGGDAENILGFYALMLRPGQTLRLPARSPAQVFHLIEGSVEAQIVDSTFTLAEADTCCAPGYEAVTLTNRSADKPSFVFIADETPLHRKLGVYEIRNLNRARFESTHTMTTYLWTPPAVQSLPVRGKNERLPINRLFFVGRNYHAHAVEMGKPVDKTVERPFYFTKAPQTLVESGATVAYPPETSNYHFEMEMVVAIGAPAFRVSRPMTPQG